MDIENTEIDLGQIESSVGGGRATATDVRIVHDATSSCKNVQEIATLTGISVELVGECIDVLKALGVVAEESDGRMCNVDAVCELCNKFERIKKLCK